MNLAPFFTACLALGFQESEVPPVRLPPGFEIIPFAGNSLAPDIYTLAISPAGKVIVSSRGYTRELIDRNSDGRADSFATFSSYPADGATGLLVESKDFFYTGNNGLWRQRLDGKGHPTASPPDKLLALQTAGEHSAHAVVRGPDGALYILCGNNSGVKAIHATDPHSPVKDPIGGAVLRYRPETDRCAIFADGFRNPYGMDFSQQGELFTFDSDNERCIALPWYEPTRFYHVVPGGRYGWWNPQRAEAWRSPPWHADIVPPAATLGRGSPTGVLCYKANHFPIKYRGGFFLLDWTFGKIWFCPLKQEGATWKSTPEEFLTPIGNAGFAPTGIAVHPASGELYVSIGGRGTRGGVYRIRYRGNPPGGTTTNPIGRVQSAREWVQQVKEGTPFQRRLALEYFALNPMTLTDAQATDALRSNLDHPDRFVRGAATLFAKGMPLAKQANLEALANTPLGSNTIGFALVRSQPQKIGQKALMRAVQPTIPKPVRLDALRLFQISLGDFPDRSQKGKIWEGYSLATSNWKPDETLLVQLREAYPTGDDLLDLELERTFALLEDHDAEVANKIVLRLGSAEDPARDIHRLAALGEMHPKFSKETRALVILALLSLEERFEKLRQPRDRNWPIRVREIFSVLSGKDPGLLAGVAQDSSFGEPHHAHFVEQMGKHRKAAAEKLARNILAKPDLNWPIDAVNALNALDLEKAVPAWRALWGLHGFDILLAKKLALLPDKADLEKFVTILDRLPMEDLHLIINALSTLSPLKQDHLQKTARRLAQLPITKEAEKPRGLLFDLLRKNLKGVPKSNNLNQWLEWAEKNNAGIHRALTGQGAATLDWPQKKNEVAWEKGNAQAGLRVFQSHGCAVCHGGSQALGPDLAGVATRFSRDDLFSAILFPDRDVPARYRATAFTTHTGKVELGLIVYESAEGVILQNSKGETVRLLGSEIASKEQTPRSLMPAGLLNDLENDDFAHLYAYLKTLAPK